MVFGQQYEVFAGPRVALRVGLCGDVCLHAEDRLYFGLAAGVIEILYAEHVPVVGDRDCGHSQGLGTGYELIDAACAVEY